MNFQPGDTVECFVKGSHGKKATDYTADVVAIVPAGERPCDVMMSVDLPDVNLMFTKTVRWDRASFLLLAHRPAGPKRNPLLYRSTGEGLKIIANLKQEAPC